MKFSRYAVQKNVNSSGVLARSSSAGNSGGLSVEKHQDQNRLAAVQALTRNSDLLHMLMAMHHRERGATSQEAEPEAAPPQQQQEVNCRVT